MNFTALNLVCAALTLSIAVAASPQAEIEALGKQILTPSAVQKISIQPAAANREGVALLSIRSAADKVGREEIAALVQSLRSAMAQGGLSLTTLEELNAGALPPGSDQDSVVTRAQSLGIQQVLFAEIASVNLRENKIADRSMHQLDLRAGLTLHSAARGSALESITETISRRGFDAQALTMQAFSDLGASLGKRAKDWKNVVATGKTVTIEIRAKIDGMRLPFLPGADEPVALQDLPLYAEGADVEIDGVRVGQAPCRVEIWQGLHRLRVSRQGVASREVTVQINGSGTHDLTLTPDEASQQAFNKQLVALEQIRQAQREGRQQAELLAAKAEAMRGLAAFLRQSGLRIDQRKIEDEESLSTRPSAAEPAKATASPSKP